MTRRLLFRSIFVTRLLQAFMSRERCMISETLQVYMLCLVTHIVRDGTAGDFCERVAATSSFSLYTISFFALFLHALLTNIPASYRTVTVKHCTSYVGLLYIVI